MTTRITELQGDGIGPELAEAVHAVADALPIDLAFEPVDWSLERREAEGDVPIDEAEASMRATKLALKYPTVTRSRSPNALIRRRIGFSVIYRPAISIKGISSNFKENVNLHIVRIATGGTYDDPGQLIGNNAAVSLRMVEREPCEQAAKFAFELARKKGLTMTSSSKHTIQRVTDGLFESVVGEVREHGYQDIEHHVELFDALLAKIILKPQDFEVILVLNEYGDFLSDMASGLVGSLGTGASGNFSFRDDHAVDVAMFDPAGGTAPDIAGSDKCNPSAIFLAFGMLLDHIDRYDLGHALRLAVLGAIEDGETTADLGGRLRCSEFTQVVIGRLPQHLPPGAGGPAA
ncbi:MAG: isocitrate/isopropylmalate family dehydrogenase [Halofilum sp. (in: g-proteobacteria)]|nr:isocitrate/isopropylmalate family dehydrogenase [Halofilum sp. (in: g-proteobacteria)]